MSEPLVSVIIPTYQCERTLGAAISSALTQTYPNVEIVVCIDGATDRSEAIARAHGDLVRVVTQENQGISTARNVAIENTTGEYIVLLDGDDILLPNFVEASLQRLRDAGTNHGFVACNAVKMSRHGLIGTVFAKPASDLSKQRMLMLEGNIATGHALFPKAMWEELGGFATEFRGLEDWDFWTRAVFHGWTLHFVTQPAAIYRLTPGSAMSRSDFMESYYQPVRRHTLETLGDRMTPEEIAYVKLTLEHPSKGRMIELAAEALAARDTPRAVELLRVASLVSPSDRRLRLKVEAMDKLPVVDRLYRWREQRRLSAHER